MLRTQGAREKASVRLLLATVAVAVLAGCGAAPHDSQPLPRTHAAGPFTHSLGSAHLARGSDPAALPGDLLIADRSNNRLLVVDPQGQIRWRFGSARTLPLPDDAFFSPDGSKIVAT